MAQLPEPYKLVSAQVARLREEVRQLRNRSPFSGTGQEVIDNGQVAQTGSVTITSPGSLVVDGGDVVMLAPAPSAVQVFKIGTMPNGDRGVAIRRTDNTEAIAVRDTLGAGRQTLQLVDPSGGRMFAESTLSFAGFDAPHMEHRFIPTDYTSGANAQSTSSTTFVATHEHRGFRMNPALKPQFMARCSDATTAGEIRIWDVVNGVYLGGFFGSPAIQTITIPAATTAFTLFQLASGACALPGQMSSDLYLQVHVRRTAGTGTVSVAPVRTVGSGF